MQYALSSSLCVCQIYKLFALAGKDHCSDDLTNETFEYLAEELPAIYAKSVGTLVLECIMLIVSACVSFLRR
jgi:hypothetical protein